DGGTPAPGDDTLRYQPTPDRSGIDVFSYGLCYPEGCSEAVVTVYVKPMTDLTLEVDARSGARDVPQVSTRDRDGTSWHATPLVAPNIAYNDYNSFGISVLPGDPRLEWRVLVDATGSSEDADFDLIVSVDA